MRSTAKMEDKPVGVAAIVIALAAIYFILLRPKPGNGGNGGGEIPEPKFKVGDLVSVDPACVVPVPILALEWRESQRLLGIMLPAQWWYMFSQGGWGPEQLLKLCN